MIKTYQRRHSKHKRIGDCLQASVSSLLSLAYESVPDFVNTKNASESLIKFVESEGYVYSGILINPFYKRFGIENQIFFDKINEYSGVGGLFLATVYSPKHFTPKSNKVHAVIVNKDFKIVHDPNADYKNVKYPCSETIGFNGVVRVYLINSRN